MVKLEKSNSDRYFFIYGSVVKKEQIYFTWMPPMKTDSIQQISSTLPGYSRYNDGFKKNPVSHIDNYDWGNPITSKGYYEYIKSYSP
jgi:hypothetical protein